MRFLKRISANSKSKKKESISDYHSIYTPPKQIETKDQMVSEILSLQFLMTPRILHLSLKNQQSIPYIFHLSLMPKSITPFSENYLFEWKNINNSKTVLFLNKFHQV